MNIVLKCGLPIQKHKNTSRLIFTIRSATAINRKGWKKCRLRWKLNFFTLLQASANKLSQSYDMSIFSKLIADSSVTLLHFHVQVYRIYDVLNLVHYKPSIKERLHP